MALDRLWIDAEHAGCSTLALGSNCRFPYPRLECRITGQEVAWLGRAIALSIGFGHCVADHHLEKQMLQWDETFAMFAAHGDQPIG